MFEVFKSHGKQFLLFFLPFYGLTATRRIFRVEIRKTYIAVHD